VPMRANKQIHRTASRVRTEYPGWRERVGGETVEVFSLGALVAQENSSPAIYPEVAANTVTRLQLSVAAVRSRIVGSRASIVARARSCTTGVGCSLADIGEEKRDACSVVRCEATPRTAISKKTP